MSSPSLAGAVVGGAFIVYVGCKLWGVTSAPDTTPSAPPSAARAGGALADSADVVLRARALQTHLVAMRQTQIEPALVQFRRELASETARLTAAARHIPRGTSHEQYLRRSGPDGAVAVIVARVATLRNDIDRIEAARVLNARLEQQVGQALWRVEHERATARATTGEDQDVAGERILEAVVRRAGIEEGAGVRETVGRLSAATFAAASRTSGARER